MHTLTTTDHDLELGAKLGEIIQDSTERARFAEKPEETLSSLGLATDMKIYADTADKVHLVIPAKVDEARIAAGDETYFEELGRLALASCHYEEMPD
ncbi:hypothetical protein [Labrenzia sp. PHM005]|uniref:hypothetical protein n=1 Tax=Labrenzia sp. PHM005 TaxID=2590016 RepID=UPI00114052A6|nr:hypothetical protein [Labrenzia sp. PHM005]QDG77492.1 hypothetical protein FJ695_17355 [Labrenzia sp. PHM005]